MFDNASADLPMTVKASNYGRATKVIAQALKARMYLYAASPQFNGNADMYKNFKNKDGQLLMNLTYDKNKWKTAMDECKKAIDHGTPSPEQNCISIQRKGNLPEFNQAIAMHVTWL